jgi:dCMP deaminase
MKKNDWRQNYMRLAREVSTWSKDPSTKIGAIAVGENGQILSQGYNGFPRGIQDTEERLTNREVKYDYMVHGEMNCIYNACLNGVSLKNSTIYVWGLPVCHICCNGLLQVGASAIIMGHPVDIHPRWEESWTKTKGKLIEARIKYGRYAYEASDVLLESPRTISIASRVNGNGHYVTRDYSGDESQPERTYHY